MISAMVTDHELWEAIKNNDEQAFAKLFYRYSTKIYSKAYSIIRDKEACEQIVHDLFLGLWNSRNVLQIDSFSAYLTSAARYQIYKHKYSSKVIPIEYKEVPEEMVYLNHNSHNEGYNRLVEQELELEVDSCLSALPKRCQEIYIMSRRQQLSNDEIADELGISKRTVENQITNALKHLRFSFKDISA